MSKINLKQLNTFVYIDASNIKNALRVLNVTIDWQKLYSYFKENYINLRQIMYFEGIDRDDVVKQKEFNGLKNIGYLLKTLSRKSYIDSPKNKIYKCKYCQKENTVNISPKSVKLKSNVDVYLCTEVLANVISPHQPIHIIILSCDGDYAEMIRKILDLKKDIFVSVFATPFTKNNNYLSIRLKELQRIDRYYLVNILNIKDKISSIKTKMRVTPKWDSRTVSNYIKK